MAVVVQTSTVQSYLDLKVFNTPIRHLDITWSDFIYMVIQGHIKRPKVKYAYVIYIFYNIQSLKFTFINKKVKQ